MQNGSKEAYSSTPSFSQEVKQKFMGYGQPRYTGIPDIFFDEQMQDLTEAELKVMLYIFRRTYGFKKEVDAISHDQFLFGIKTRDGRQLDKGAGVSITSLKLALNKLTERGYIFRHKRQGKGGVSITNLYELNISGEPTYREGSKSDPYQGSKSDPSPGQIPTPTLRLNQGSEFDPTIKQNSNKQKEGSNPFLPTNREELEPPIEPATEQPAETEEQFRERVKREFIARAREEGLTHND